MSCCEGFDEKIRELEQKLANLKDMLIEQGNYREEILNKLAIAKDMLDGAAVSFEWIRDNSVDEVKEYSTGSAASIRNLVKELNE